MSTSAQVKVRRNSRKVVVAGTAAVGALAIGVVTPAPAQAWAWDGHVQVIATTYSCGISSNSGWAWYSADDGESGWATKGDSGTIVFDLHRVPGYGSSTLVTIKWGAGGCSQVRFRVISRPGYGTTQAIGNLN